MSEQTCSDRGCCWDASQSGLPWCFYTQSAPDDPDDVRGPVLRYAGAQSPPTVASVLGSAHAAVAGDAAAGLACLSLPPLAGECDFTFDGPAAAYSWPFDAHIGGQLPALELSFTWLPHELRRTAATAAGATVMTAIRISGSLPLALLEVNISGGVAAANASFALPMHFSLFPGTWDWGRVPPPTPRTTT